MPQINRLRKYLGLLGDFLCIWDGEGNDKCRQGDGGAQRFCRCPLWMTHKFSNHFTIEFDSFATLVLIGIQKYYSIALLEFNIQLYLLFTHVL